MFPILTLLVIVDKGQTVHGEEEQTHQPAVLRVENRRLICYFKKSINRQEDRTKARIGRTRRVGDGRTRENGDSKTRKKGDQVLQAQEQQIFR